MAYWSGVHGYYCFSRLHDPHPPGQALKSLLTEVATKAVKPTLAGVLGTWDQAPYDKTNYPRTLLVPAIPLSALGRSTVPIIFLGTWTPEGFFTYLLYREYGTVLYLQFAGKIPSDLHFIKQSLASHRLALATLGRSLDARLVCWLQAFGIAYGYPALDSDSKPMAVCSQYWL